MERTREISARCDKEEMNFLALNLANDVATGNKTIEKARIYYAEAAMALYERAKVYLYTRVEIQNYTWQYR